LETEKLSIRRKQVKGKKQILIDFSEGKILENEKWKLEECVA
jgi:hypothetical protein